MLLVLVTSSVFSMAQNTYYDYVPMARTGAKWVYGAVLEGVPVNGVLQRVVALRSVEVREDTTIQTADAIINGNTSKSHYKKVYQRVEPSPIDGWQESEMLIGFAKEKGDKWVGRSQTSFIHTAEYLSNTIGSGFGTPRYYELPSTAYTLLVIDKTVKPEIVNGRSFNDEWRYIPYFNVGEVDSIWINGRYRLRWRSESDKNKPENEIIFPQLIEGVGYVNVLPYRPRTVYPSYLYNLSTYWGEFTGQAPVPTPFSPTARTGYQEMTQDPYCGYGSRVRYVSLLYTEYNGVREYQSPAYYQWIENGWMDEVTAAEKIEVDKTSAKENRWYNLQGQAFEEKPTASGVYIHNGEKVVIK